MTHYTSIDHLKNEHRLERNRLGGVAGDAINALLSAAAIELPEAPRSFWFYFLRALLGALLRLRLLAASTNPSI